MNGPPHSALVVPEPLDEDDDDIRWALHTAAVQWGRGAREDAVAWVRRGADAAVDGGFWERASQLNVSAAQLERALLGETSSQAPPASNPTKALPRLPTPAHSAVPKLTPSQTSLANTSTVKPVALSRPAPVRTPTLTSSAPGPGTRWPTGFPRGPPASATPSGRAIAPPPPLPASVKKAPIPPPPKTKSRSAHSDDVEIEISDDATDLSEDEQLALGDEISYGSHSAFTKPSVGAAPPAGLPTYDLEEDPMDGTTVLPAETPHVSSFPPASLDGLGLPAFPLEDTMRPAEAPATSPRMPDSLRINQPPPLPSMKPVEPPQASRRSPSLPLRPLGTHNLAQWASRDEPDAVVRRAVPSQTAPRQSPPSQPSCAEAIARPSREPTREEPTGKYLPQNLPASRRTGPTDVDDVVLVPLTTQASRDGYSAAPLSQEDERDEPSGGRATLDSDLLEPVDDDGHEPPSTARGLGQLGSGPPGAADEPVSETPLSSPMSSAPLKASSTRPPPARGISVPAPSSVGSTVRDRAELAPPSRFSQSEPPTSVRERGNSERPLATRSDIQSELPRVPPLGKLPLLVPAEEALEGPPSSAVPSINGIAFSDVRGLCDLPQDAQRLLRKRARIERMGAGEDLSFFAVVLVLEGWVKLMPAIADTTCATASAGDVVFTQGSLEDGVALRVVAGQNGTTLATWDKATFNEITDACPWVADELRLIADSFQALAGTTLGLLGERLDDALREVVTSRCRVLTLLPHEVLVARGKRVPGMHIVGGGSVELLDESDAVVGSCSLGEFLLTAQVLAGGVSPHTVRAYLADLGEIFSHEHERRGDGEDAAPLTVGQLHHRVPFVPRQPARKERSRHRGTQAVLAQDVLSHARAP